MNSDLRKFFNDNKKELAVVLSVIFTTFLVIGALNYFSGSGISISGVNVPNDFLEARMRVSASADKIASLTGGSASSLGVISEADRNGEYLKGLDLVNSEIEKNKELGEAAAQLSEELGEMANALEAVGPREAVNIGTQAVSTGIELVKQLVNYQNSTQELLSALQYRLENNGGGDTRARIEGIISTMNGEARAINDLSNEYKNLMSEFDKLTT